MQAQQGRGALCKAWRSGLSVEGLILAASGCPHQAPLKEPAALSRWCRPDTEQQWVLQEPLGNWPEKQIPVNSLIWSESSRAQQGTCLKPAVQLVEVQQPEEPQVPRASNTESPCAEQEPDLLPETTFMFLFTLLGTPEAKDPESNIQACARTEEPGPLAGRPLPPASGSAGPALVAHPSGNSEIQESRFLSQQDWGLQQTSEEMKHLQAVCMRLREALSTTQADNLALGEKLRNLPSALYEKLKEGMLAGPGEAKNTQAEAQAAQDSCSGTGQTQGSCPAPQDQAPAPFPQPLGSQRPALLLLPPDPPHVRGNPSALARPRSRGPAPPQEAPPSASQ